MGAQRQLRQSAFLPLTRIRNRVFQEQTAARNREKIGRETVGRIRRTYRQGIQARPSKNGVQTHTRYGDSPYI